MSQSIDSIADLKARIKDSCDLLWTAKEALNIVSYLTAPSQGKEEFFKRTNYFLRWSQIVNWRMAVIEVHKIVSKKDNDAHSLKKIFNIIRANIKKLSITEHDVLGWEAKLSAEANVIGEIEKQRDKVYAHTDLNAKNITSTLAITDIENLIQIILDIFNGILSKMGEPVYSMAILGHPTDGAKMVIDALVVRDNCYEQLEKG